MSAHLQEDVPPSVCAFLWRFVLICARRLGFHPSESDNYRPPLFSVVTCAAGPSGCAEGPREARRKRRQLLVSPECWDARWRPDWFSGPLPNSLSPPLPLCVSEVRGGGLNFWTRTSQRARGLIYEQKSSRVQFLKAAADNGGVWMEQFVTSSSPLTFTGWRPVGLKGALLGNHDGGKSQPK